MDKKKNINTNSYNKVNNKLNNLSKTNTKEDSPTEFIKKIGDFFNKNYSNFKITKIIKTRNKLKFLHFFEKLLSKFLPNLFSWSFLITINKI